MVRQMAGAGNVVDALSTLLYARSEGNPLFIHELLYDWIETGQIEISGGQWQIKDLTHGQIPTRVSDIIRQRLERVNEDALALAEIAAVIGPNFDLDLVRETGGWDEGAALAALDELLDHYLVRERSKGRRFDFAFTHQLTQATLYANIPADVRRRRHRRIGQVLADLHGDRLDEMAGYLAHHFEQGGLPEEAAHHYHQAAQRALTIFADDEALEFLTQGLALTTRPRLRWDLLLLRESIYHRRGQREQQQTDLAELAQLAGILNDNECYCELLMRRIGLQHALGQRDEEATLIEQLKGYAACLDNPNWQANTLRVEAIYLLSTGEYDRAGELLPQALNTYRSLNNRKGEVKCCCTLAQLATERGHLNEVMPLVQQARNLAETEANYLLLFRVIYVAAHAAFVQKNYNTCEELCQQALDLCQQTGYLEGEADTQKLLGSVANRLFDIPQSFKYYNRAKTLYARLDKLQGQAAVLMNMGILSVSLGRYEEGGHAFAQAHQLFEQLQDVRGQMLSTLNLSAVALYQEDYPAAKSAAQASLNLARQLQTVHIEANALGNLGEAERELGEIDQAITHLQTALALRRSMETRPVDTVNDLCQLALAYLRQNNPAAAQQTCAELLDILQADEPSLLYPQQVLWVSAQTYYALGNPAQANEFLQAAYARLQTKLAAIPDDETRQTYIQLRFNQEILAAYKDGSWLD
ncbi:MAG: tetratricopeptide repeat protein [Anaerolineae bacterium]|nr:tetratricopeptide repeat protein [Anaerolineae bacterium]